MRHSPKKARREPPNSNPERVLHDIPMPAPVEASMPFETSSIVLKRLIRILFY